MREYLERWLAEAETELARFEKAVADHGLRVVEREAGAAERDVTDRERQRLRRLIEEYRAALRAG